MLRICLGVGALALVAVWPRFFSDPVAAPCAGDTDGNRVVTISEVIQAVHSSLYGCR